MEVKSKITFIYRNNEEAQIALNSLKPDNMDFISSSIEDNVLIFNLESKSLRTIIATIDDIIFCEIMNEKILDFNND